MAAPFVRSIGAFRESGVATTLPLPASYEENDVLLAVIGTANQNLAAITGYSEVDNSPQSVGTAGSAGGVRIIARWKYASASESDPALPDSGQYQCGFLVAIGGCDTGGTPWDVTAGDTAAASTSLSCPSVTTTVAETLVLNLVSFDWDNTGSADGAISGWANANLSSVTEYGDDGTAVGAGGGIAIAGGELSAAGSSGSTTATIEASTATALLTIAFKPPGSAPTGYTLTADGGTFSLTGQTASLERGRRLAADSGSFSLTGQDASLTKGRTLAADGGSFSLTGQAATLKVARRVTAASGSFTLTGQAASLERGFQLGADSASFALTGQDASFARGYGLAAASGTFALTGQAATLTASRVLTAGSGAFTLTGQSASLARSYPLTAGSGAFSLTGGAASLLRGFALPADSGAFVLTGQDATLSTLTHYSLAADGGAFVLTGQDATLTYAIPSVPPVLESYATNYQTATTVTTSTPTGTAAGDLLVFIASSDTASDVPTYTTTDLGSVNSLVAYDTSTYGGATTTHQAWWRFAGSSEPADFDLGISVSRPTAFSIVRISGADPSNPIADVQSAANDSGAASEPVAPDATATAQSLVLRSVAWDEGKTLNAGPSETLVYHSDELLHDQILYQKDQTSAGATGTASFDLSSGTRWIAATIVIRSPVAATFTLQADAGSFALTGQDAAFVLTRRLSAQSGAFSLTGQDVTLSKGGDQTLSAEGGVFALTGQAATLKATRKLSAESGSFGLTGIAAALLRSRAVLASSGSFTVDGQDVAFARTWRLEAESGAFVLSGGDATLTARLGWRAVDATPETWTGTSETAETWTTTDATSGVWTATTSASETWTVTPTTSEDWT